MNLIMKKKINAASKEQDKNKIGCINFEEKVWIDNDGRYFDKLFGSRDYDLAELVVTLNDGRTIGFVDIKKIEIGNLVIKYKKNQALKDIEKKLRKNKK